MDTSALVSGLKSEVLGGGNMLIQDWNKKRRRRIDEDRPSLSRSARLSGVRVEFTRAS